MFFMHPAQWLSTGEVADLLGVTARTVYGLIDEGQLPASRSGRLIKVRVSDLDAYLSSVRIVPGTLRPKATGA